MLQRILKNAGRDALLYFPVKLIPALTSLVTVPLFTRMIAPADYGYFYTITATTSLVLAFTQGWITSSAVRYFWIARREHASDAYTATTLWLALAMLTLGSLVVGGAVWLARPLMDPGLARLVPMGIAAYWTSGLFAVLLQVLRAANRARPYAILSTAMTLITTGIAVWLVWQHDTGSIGILIGSVVGYAVLIPFGIRQMGREGSLAPGHTSRDYIREFFSYGMPLTIAGMSGWALVLADRYVLLAFRTASEVGVYSVAYGLGDKIMQLLIAPMLMTIGPMLIQTYEQHGQELAEQTQTQFTRYFLMTTLPLLAGMAVAGPDFMATFTGPKYQEASSILWLVSAGATANGLAQIAGAGLGLHKRSAVIMQNSLFSALFNVGVNLLTVPRFGYPAAAVNTLLSYVLLLALTWYRTRPYMAWRLPVVDLMRVVAACAAMSAVVWFAFPGAVDSVWLLLAQAGVGLVLYVAALLLMGGIKPAERAWLMHGIRTRVLRRGGE